MCVVGVKCAFGTSLPPICFRWGRVAVQCQTTVWRGRWDGPSVGADGSGKRGQTNGDRQTGWRRTLLTSYHPNQSSYPQPRPAQSSPISDQTGPAPCASSSSLTPSERQKLLRLIKRFQKTASASSATDKETKRAEQDLERARVMLNYILHFP